MRVNYRLADPAKFPCTVTLTATVEELDALINELPERWPAYDLRCALRQAVADAKKVFTGDSKDMAGD